MKNFLLGFIISFFLPLYCWGERAIVIYEPQINHQKIHVKISGLEQYLDQSIALKAYFFQDADSLIVFNQTFWVDQDEMEVQLKSLNTANIIDLKWEIWPEGPLLFILSTEDRSMARSFFYKQSAFEYSLLNQSIKDYVSKNKISSSNLLNTSYAEKLMRSVGYSGSAIYNEEQGTLEVFDRNNLKVHSYTYQELISPPFYKNPLNTNSQLIGDNLLTPLLTFDELFKERERIKDLKKINIFNNSFYQSASSDESLEENYTELGGTVQFELFNNIIDFNFYVTTLDKNRTSKARFINFDYDRAQVERKKEEAFSAYRAHFESRKQQFLLVENEFEHAINNKVSSIHQELKDTLLMNEYLSALKDGDISNMQVASISDSIKTVINESLVLMDQLKQLRNVNIQDSLNYLDFVNQLASKSTYQNFLQDPHFDPSVLKEQAISKKWSIQKLSLGNSYLDNSFKDLNSTYFNGLQFSFNTPLGTSSVYSGQVDHLDYFSSNMKQTMLGTAFESRTFYRSSVYLNYLSYTNDLKGIQQYFNQDSEGALPKFKGSSLGLGIKSQPIKALSILAEVQNNLNNNKIEEVAHVDVRDRLNILIEASLSLPFQSTELNLKYDETGKYFKNINTSIQKSGVSILEARIRTHFYKSRVRLELLGLQVLQSNLSTESQQLKWGAVLKTQFKGYPNIEFSYHPYSTIVLTDSLHPFDHKQVLGEVLKSQAVYQKKYLQNHWMFVLTYVSSSSSFEEYTTHLNQMNGMARYINPIWNIYFNVQYYDQSGNISYGQNINGRSLLFQVGTDLNAWKDFRIGPSLELGSSNHQKYIYGLGLNLRKSFYKEMFQAQWSSKISNQNVLDHSTYFRVNFSLFFNLFYK